MTSPCSVLVPTPVFFSGFGRGLSCSMTEVTERANDALLFLVCGEGPFLWWA